MDLEEKKRELILYDFCGTIVDFQTGNAFVRYVLNKKGIPADFYEKLRIFLNKIGFIKHFNYIYPKIAINKSLLLYQLRGLKYEELNELAYQYYEERIKPHFIGAVIDTIKKHHLNKALIILNSAGYAIYLKYFAEEFDIPILLASEFEYRNGIFTGKVLGKDNYGQEKVRRLRQYLGEKEFAANFSGIIGYSDSYSDMPILKCCDHVVCVNRGPCPEKWMIDLGADIICY